MIRLVLILLSLAGGAGAGIYGLGAVLDRTSEGSAARSERQSGPVKVRVVEVGVATVTDTVEAVGTTRAVRAIDVRPEISGLITEIDFETGERVEAGERLVQFDDRAERAELKRVRAVLEEARGALDRAETLQERNVTSEASLETARANFLAAQAGVEAAQNAVDDRRILAPFGGTTGLVTLDIGQYIAATTIVTTLDDLSTVEIAFALPEPYFSRVDTGLTVEATNAAYPDRTFTGKVSEVGTRIAPSTRAFDVRATIGNRDGSLVTGMFMNVRAALGSRRSVTVPEQSIVDRADETFVFVAQDGIARRVEVVVGRRLGDDVEILDGLEAGQRVVVAGVQSVEDGAPIVAVSDAPTDRPV